MYKTSYWVIISAEKIKELILEYAIKEGLNPTGEFHICDDGSASVGYEDKA